MTLRAHLDTAESSEKIGGEGTDLSAGDAVL